MNSIKDANIAEGTRVFVRADLDVPIRDGKIQNTFRLDSSLETLQYLSSKKAKILIAGKIGRPEGAYNESLSTKQLQPYFEKNLPNTDFEILENLRFDVREEFTSDEFAQELAQKADIYVNECFATSHRDDTSIVALPKFLPSYAGITLMKEVEALKKVIKEPNRPLVSIIGGAKLSTKKPVVSKFLEISEYVLVGGKIGLDWSEAIPDNLMIPIDYSTDTKDIGVETVEEYKKIIKSAKSIIWNGPMGLFEEPPFDKATNEIAKVIVESGAYSVIGGGDTVAAISNLGLLDKFNFVSTGGGAMLEFITKENLPGLEVLGYRG